MFENWFKPQETHFLSPIVQGALRAYHRSTEGQTDLRQLRCVQALCQQESHLPDAFAWRMASNLVLQQALFKLAQMHPTHATLIDLHYVSRLTDNAVAHKLHMSTRHATQMKREAIDYLAQVIEQLESAASRRGVE